MTQVSNYLPSPRTKRLLILRRVLDMVQSIQAGTEVLLPNGAIYVYTQSVGLVVSAFIDITELSDGEFPAVFVIPDDATSFDNDADGWSADATWNLSVVLNIKGNTVATVRDDGPLSLTVELTELLFQDLSVALLAQQNLGQPVDTVLSIERMVPNPYVDPGFSQAVLDVQVRYVHNFFA